MRLSGSIVALVTPMTKAGGIDKLRLQQLLEWHLEAGTHGFVINGTTGESATITNDEQSSMLAFALEVVGGKVPVIAGTGTNSTASTIESTRHARDLGADAALVVTPYYNRPTQAGLYQHYKEVSEKSNLPVILYNVPKRTGCDLLDETVIELAKLDNIVGIKDATGDLLRLKNQKQGISKDFVYLSGDDPTCFEYIKNKGVGVISVASNIVPDLMSLMCAYALNAEYNKAEIINDKLSNLYGILGIESNPIPCKWILNYIDKIDSGIRLPLTNLSPQNQEVVLKVIQQLGLTK